MFAHGKDDGLSEVIGFILIIAILVVIASLYVTYVVPAQGREAEIEHMTYIKDKFVDIKISLDSLWINQETDIDLIQNIEMGTLGQMTQGQFVFIPLANPVGSAGKITVDTTDASGEITITLTRPLVREPIPDEQDWIDDSNKVKMNPDLYRQMQYEKTLFPVDIINTVEIPIDVTIPEDPNDFSGTDIVDFPLLTVIPDLATDEADANWVASFHLKRIPTFIVADNAAFQGDKSAEYLDADYRYYLIMDLERKNLETNSNYPSFQEFIISSYEERPTSPILINLQDPAYGLDAYGRLIVKNLVAGGPLIQDIHYQNELFNDAIRSSYQVGIDPDPAIPITIGPEPLGSLSYSADNYYWVKQSYIYQMGGVFLSQQDGTVSRTLPLLSLGAKDGKPEVKLTLLRITGFDRKFAGTTPVQIVTRITGIRKNIIRVPHVGGGFDDWLLAPAPDNVESVEIQFEHPDESIEKAWENSFTAIRDAAVPSGFDPDWAVVDSAPSSIIIDNDPLTEDIDISLDYTEVDVEILLQPIGWQGS